MSNSLTDRCILSLFVRLSTTSKGDQWELSRLIYKRGGVTVGNIKPYICLVPIACSSFHYDYTTLIPDMFKNENVYAIYNKAFKVVHDKSYWPPYEGPKLFHNPNMQRLKKGRPNSTRIRTEMDEEVEERTSRLCGLYRHPDHIRRNCPTNKKRQLISLCIMCSTNLL